MCASSEYENSSAAALRTSATTSGWPTKRANASPVAKQSPPAARSASAVAINAANGSSGASPRTTRRESRSFCGTCCAWCSGAPSSHFASRLRTSASSFSAGCARHAGLSSSARPKDVESTKSVRLQSGFAVASAVRERQVDLPTNLATRLLSCAVGASSARSTSSTVHSDARRRSTSAAASTSRAQPPAPPQSMRCFDASSASRAAASEFGAKFARSAQSSAASCAVALPASTRMPEAAGRSVELLVAQFSNT